MNGKDPYGVLGISRDATDDEVKEAYRALARKYHPDKYADSDLAELAEEKMKEVNVAYEEIRRERRERQERGRPEDSTDAYQPGNGGSNQSGGEYARVRAWINGGEIEQAEQALNAVPERQRGGEWYFLKGCVLLRRGRGFDAQNCFDRACAMDPYNTEYQTARSQLRNRTAAFGSGYRTEQTDAPCSACDLCSTLLCMNCFCNCCGH